MSRRRDRVWPVDSDAPHDAETAIVSAPAAARPTGGESGTGAAPDQNIEDLFDWSAVTERAVDAIVVAPPLRDIGPVGCLDHYCFALLEAVQRGQDLWTMLWVEARRDPFGDVAGAVVDHRTRLLRWATEKISGYQRQGLVDPGTDAESVATAVLVALEVLLPIVRSNPVAAPEAYGATRTELLDRYVRRTARRPATGEPPLDRGRMTT